MPLTIAIDGKGVIANADAEVNDTGGTGTGDWGFVGSGGVGWGLTTDVFLYGSSCMSMALSGSGKNGWLYFDLGAGNELDFDTAGSEEGQHIYLWIHCPTIGLAETLANVGVGIRIGSSTTDYRTFTFAGNDGSNGWDGGWNCFVIDPTKAGSIADGGTFDVGAVRYIGIRGETTAVAKGDNFFIDQIAVGFGLRITGSSTTGWKDAVDYCTDYPNRAWGMLQEREGIYFAYGTINIGDASAQAAAVSFVDSGRIIQFGVSEYYYSAAWVTSADIAYSGINVEDHTSWDTEFADGVVVGSDKGRSGSVIIGNSNHNVSLDLYGGNHANSLTKLYGTTLKDLTGSINSGNDADHVFYSVSFLGCAQFDPVGAPEIRNCVFAETVDVDAALLWNESIDIQGCSFIANILGAAVEHPSAAGSPYTHTNLVYTGNTYDVLNSSGSAIIITKAGISDPSTYEGSTVTYQASLTITITVQDVATDPIQNVQTAVYKTSDRTELMNEDTTALGVATEDYVGGTPVNVEIRCRKSSGTPKYLSFSTLATLTGDFDLLVTLEEDPNA